MPSFDDANAPFHDDDDSLDCGLPSTPMITINQFNALTAEDAPFAILFGLHAEDIGRGTARFRMIYGESMKGLRQSVTGAALMALADYAIYGVVLSVVGPVPLAVTTHLDVNLVRRCPPGDVVCEASLIRAGRRLVTVQAWLRSAATGHVVAHATGTYSVPPPEKR